MPKTANHKELQKRVADTVLKVTKNKILKTEHALLKAKPSPEAEKHKKPEEMLKHILKNDNLQVIRTQVNES